MEGKGVEEHPQNKDTTEHTYPKVIEVVGPVVQLFVGSTRELFRSPETGLGHITTVLKQAAISEYKSDNIDSNY